MADPDVTENVSRQKASSLSVRKKLFFSAVAVLLAVSLLEVVLRAVEYQACGSRPLALQAVAERLSKNLRALKIERELESARRSLNQEIRLADGSDDNLPGNHNLYQLVQLTWGKLFGDEGADLLAEFQSRYREHFSKLAAFCRAGRAKLVVVYLPQAESGSWQVVSEEICRTFFRGLAAEHEADFLDLTEELKAHDWRDVSLLPKDRHLSRFGNRIVAAALGAQLARYKGYRSPRQYDGTPDLCGDLLPRLDETWDFRPRMPTPVITNRHGFRMTNDLQIPKARQRVLILGDSFTFGPGLPNAHTYPAILQERCGYLEVVNAGVCGYTISDEVALFTERARFVAPDIVVLQVLDNDLYGFFYFFLNKFDRAKRSHVPSRLEKEFLECAFSKSPQSKQRR